jgi:uncharacterized protein with ParB-like and HNH nuclease domain
MEYQENTKYNLSYYGADYPVDSLVQRMRENEIIIPHFQREYVWKHDEASKFIESLILRLPVPSIFLLRDKQTNNLIIIDGQQRLKTLLYFFDGRFPDGKTFALKGVLKEYEKRTYNDLAPSDQRELRNSIIHCIVIMDEDDSDAPYHIFERLNTTGTPLTSQEIRSALYFGQFNDLLIELSQLGAWREITYKDIRLTDQEYILRLIAMYYDLEQYNGSMKSFLNQFMLMNRNLENFSGDEVKSFFIPTVELLSKYYAHRNKAFSIAFFEPIFYFIAKHLQEDIKHRQLGSVLSALENDEEYSRLCKSSTSTRSSVFHRFEYVKNVFIDAL